MTTAAEIISAIRDLDRKELPHLALAIAALMCESDESRPQPEPKLPEPDVLLNVTEVACLLGYRPSYVYEMLRRGDLPAIRDRKFVRVRKSAVDEYISRHEQRGPLPLKVSNMLQSVKTERKEKSRG